MTGPTAAWKGWSSRRSRFSRAVEDIREIPGTAASFLLSPQGRRFDPRLAEEIAALSGRSSSSAADTRAWTSGSSSPWSDEEISIGDYVITGGEPAAVVVVDAASRFIPGVVGKAESVAHDSFAAGRLDFPHYTRPRDFRGMKVPQVLFSGDHAKIERWRKRKALEKTLGKRPDLLDRELSPEESGDPGGNSERKERAMSLVNLVEDKQLKKDVEPFNVGDTVKVHVIIKEGDKERIQIFRGDVIGKKGEGIRASLHRPQGLVRHRRREVLPPPLQDDQEDRGRPQGQGQKGQAVLPQGAQGQGRPDQGRTTLLNHSPTWPISGSREGFLKTGRRAIAGVDEVGRGALFGPVMAVALIFPARFYGPLRPAWTKKINDSKLLSPTKRMGLVENILAEALSVGVGSGLERRDRRREHPLGLGAGHEKGDREPETKTRHGAS